MSQTHQTYDEIRMEIASESWLGLAEKGDDLISWWDGNVLHFDWVDVPWGARQNNDFQS